MTMDTGIEPPEKSRIAERVEAWKDDVTAFFRDDWSRLRTLMLVLEEDAWGDAAVAAEQQNPVTADAEASGDASSIQEGGANRKPRTQDQLSRLVAHLEYKLQVATDDRGDRRD